MITRYSDARQLLDQPGVLSSDFVPLSAAVKAGQIAAGRGGEITALIAPPLLNPVSPADHRRLRQLLGGYFTADRISNLTPRITEITVDLFDQMPAGQVFDLIDTFAFRLPVAVICELMGLPLADQDDIRSWTSGLASDDPDRSVPASHAIAAYLTEMIAAKRAAPAADLLSELVAAVDAGRLTSEELLATAVLLVHAGHETTVNLIGNTVVALADTGRWHDLIGHPELVLAAVVEGGRYDSPVRAAPYRVAMEDISMGSMTIAAGSLVLIDLQSANRDEIFDRPDEFLLDRPTLPRPLTFGHGMHFCLGVHLGQLETTIGLTELIARRPGLRLACNADELLRKASPILNGFETVPVIY